MKSFITATLLTASFFSQATIINYDEATSGDLALDDFFFDTVGNQTFKGNVTKNTTNGVHGGDGDLFDFNILAGLEVTNVIFSATVKSSTNVANAAAKTSIRNDGEQLFHESFDIINSITWGVADANELPIGNSSDLYRTGTGGLDLTLIEPSNDYSISYDWELVFQVEKANKVTSVPEPSPLALFGLGLLGLAFARRAKA
jgi:hypothetical protein